MKLVELLARELDEWPETTFCYAQDRNSAVYPFLVVPEFRPGPGVWGGHSEVAPMPYAWAIFSVRLAEDYATAIVTREQWAAERVKLALEAPYADTAWRGAKIEYVLPTLEASPLASRRDYFALIALAAIGWAAFLTVLLGGFRL